MTMQSSSLLPALRELPGDSDGEKQSIHDNLTRIISMDRAMYATEFAAGVSGGMWAILDSVNVDDTWLETVTQAHGAAFPDYEGTLHEHWTEIVNSRPDYTGDFIEELRNEAAIREAASELGNIDLGNVDDQLFDAFRETCSRVAESQTLFEFYQEKLAIGENSAYGVVSDLKGRIGEYFANDHLIENGYPDLSPASLSNQDHWDSFSQESNTYFQTQVGYEDNLNILASKMEKAIEGIGEINPDAQVFFPVTSEAFEAMSEYRPDLAAKMLDIVGTNTEIKGHVETNLQTLLENKGADISDESLAQIVENPDFLPIEGITDGLETLTGNLGIDVPDSLVEIIPFAPAIFASARLIAGAVKTEKEFKAADRTTKNKMQVVQTLALIGKFGPKTLMATIGGKGGVEIGGIVGTLAGSVVPGVGNAVGGTVGSVGGGILGIGTGMWIGRYLGERLEPHMLNLALNITGMTHDDLFYYKNKVRIDDLAMSFQGQARALAAPA